MMTKEEKDRIDAKIDIYIRGIQSVSNDAGWEGMGMLERLIDFKGQPPEPTGNDQSNVTMIKAVRLLREMHAEFPLIYGVMQIMLSQKNDEAMALLANVYYQGTCPWAEKVYTDQLRAEELGIEARVYRYNLQKAYVTFVKEFKTARMYKSLIDGS